LFITLEANLREVDCLKNLPILDGAQESLILDIKEPVGSLQVSVRGTLVPLSPEHYLKGDLQKLRKSANGFSKSQKLVSF